MTGGQDTKVSLAKCLSPEDVAKFGATACQVHVAMHQMAVAMSPLVQAMQGAASRVSQSVVLRQVRRDVQAALLKDAGHRRDMDAVFGPGFMDATDRVLYSRVPEDVGVDVRPWERVTEVDLFGVERDGTREDCVPCPYAAWAGHSGSHVWRYVSGDNRGHLSWCPGRSAHRQEDT